MASSTPTAQARQPVIHPVAAANPRIQELLDMTAVSFDRCTRAMMPNAKGSECLEMLDQGTLVVVRQTCAEFVTHVAIAFADAAPGIALVFRSLHGRLAGGAFGVCAVVRDVAEELALHRLGYLLGPALEA